MIFVNFKTYAESSGENGLKLLSIISEVCETSSVQVIPVVQAVDLTSAVAQTKIPIWVQNIDAITYGAHTGGVLPEEVKRIGAVGTCLNHSEHKLDSSQIATHIGRAKEVGLRTLVFAGGIEELGLVLSMDPDFASYEPPELVGSTTTSVSQAKPEVISQAAQICHSAGIPLIVGAGIHSTEDVRVAVQRGAVGVAVATDIVKSVDPKKSLLELLAGFS